MKSNVRCRPRRFEQVQLPELDQLPRTPARPAPARPASPRPRSKYRAEQRPAARSATRSQLVDAACAATRAPWSTGPTPASRTFGRGRRHVRAASSRSCTALRRSNTPRSSVDRQPARAAPAPARTCRARNSKCWASRKKLVWLVAIASSSTVSSAPDAIGFDVRAGSRRNAGSPQLAQPLLQPRRHQRPLAVVQRDAALLVDQLDDGAQLAIASGPVTAVDRRHQRRPLPAPAADAVGAEDAVEVEQELDACP